MQSPDSLPSAPPERQAPRDVRLPSTDARLAEIVAHPEFQALPRARRAFADEPAEILAKAVRLSPRDPLARTLVDRLRAACERSGLGEPPALVVLPGGINAFTLTSTMDGRQLVGLHADGLRLLPPGQLLFIVGHELGHARADRDGAASHVRARVRELDDRSGLSLLAKSLERRIEIECDRFGYDLSGDAEAATSALVRTATGGLEGSIDLAAVPTFFDPEIDAWAPHRESHPTVPIRVHAIRAYAARGHDADDEVDDLLDRMEVDALKRNRADVALLYAAVITLAREELAAAEPRAETVALVDALEGQLATTPPSTVDAAVALLRTRATRGRRTRVLHFLAALGADRAEPARVHRLERWRAALDLPPNVAALCAADHRSLAAALAT